MRRPSAASWRTWRHGAGAAGEGDPLTDVAFVDDIVAASLGIDGDMVDREHVRRSSWYAKLLAAAGYSTEARALLECAREIASALRDPEQAAVSRAAKQLSRTPLDALASVIMRALRRFDR